MILIISTLLWMTGAPVLLKRANAVLFTNVSDTILDSDLSVATKHTLRYTASSTLAAAGTLRIVFDPTGNAFGLGQITATTTQIVATGMTVVNTCGGGSDEVTVAMDGTSGQEGLVFTVCPTDTVPAGNKILQLGATTSPFLTNPGVANSYRVTLASSNGDVGETRVAIIDDVVVTASVDTTFTFVITGMATSTSINGETTTGYASSTFLAFGTLAPLTPKILGQRLQVTTNAANGFSVTVVEDQNLMSATGADIDLFNNGVVQVTPAAWAVPSNTLGSENTYGHIGVTSQDSTLSAGDEFGASLYAGNFDSARQVFYHNGPADGSTDNIGSTYVAYKVEIASLQEAASDYTNTLTYVATPTF